MFGLDIENFGGSGVVITAGGNVQVAGCFIGTDPTGEVAAPNGTGVDIQNSSNLVGGPAVGNRNVISGNKSVGGGDGIYLPPLLLNPINITPTKNVAENNFIGIDAGGTKALGNGEVGIDDKGTFNTFGGTTAGLGNIISGNAEGGIKSGDSGGSITRIDDGDDGQSGCGPSARAGASTAAHDSSG